VMHIRFSKPQRLHYKLYLVDIFDNKKMAIS
jgi:hypothetical protein